VQKTEDLGARVMRLRTERRLSRAALSRRCPAERPLSATAIERIEHGEHQPRLQFLEAVMNSIRNGLGMRETEIVKEPTRPWNPYFYAIFARVHNTL
jgi:transcriptional regulator with XRE-family HTH domain